MALLMMLGLLLVVFTVAAVSRLSLNAGEQKRRLATAKVLAEVRNAILGYALNSNSTTRPLGTLPCPALDTTDGNQSTHTTTGACTHLRGLVPYRTLGIAQPFDGTGSPLWYAVPTNYGGRYNNGPLRNSSLASNLTLKVNSANRTDAIAFIVLAPKTPLGTQVSRAFVASNFLEGANASNSPGAYDDLTDDTHNDEVLAMPLGSFWGLVEKRVLQEFGQTLSDYRAKCNQYPWPANYTAAGNASQNGNYEGRIPLTAVSPDWSTACASGTAPAQPPIWLTQHWANSIYYALCKGAPAVNPPASACLQLDGVSGNSNAQAILIAPGIPLSGTLPVQNRNVLALVNYFEAHNISPGDNHFTSLPPVNPTGTYNDQVFILP